MALGILLFVYMSCWFGLFCIPMLEKKMAGHPDFEGFRKCASMYFPRFSGKR